MAGSCHEEAPGVLRVDGSQPATTRLDERRDGPAVGRLVRLASDTFAGRQELYRRRGVATGLLCQSGHIQRVSQKGAPAGVPQDGEQLHQRLLRPVPVSEKDSDLRGPGERHDQNGLQVKPTCRLDGLAGHRLCLFIIACLGGEQRRSSEGVGSEVERGGLAEFQGGGEVCGRTATVTGGDPDPAEHHFAPGHAFSRPDRAQTGPGLLKELGGPLDLAPVQDSGADEERSHSHLADLAGFPAIASASL